MSQNIKEALLDCGTITSNIMDIISSILSDNNMNFSNNNKSEIIVSDTNKNEIIELLSNIDILKDGKIKLLLQITESNEKVFIRQKFN